MESLPLHPKLVHLPIALAILMPLITGGILLAWWRGWWPRQVWWAAVALQGLLLISGLVARSTGEGDEDRAERVVPHDAIEVHEEAATLFLIGGGVAFALALGALLLRSETRARQVAAATLVATLAVLYLGFGVGEAGGRLVYQYGAASAFTQGAGGTAPAATPAPAPVPATAPAAP